MDKKEKKIMTYLPVAIICLCLLALGSYVLFGILFRTHASPEFNIGNAFDQTVTVYIEGHRMTKINPGDSKVFYPYDTLPTTQDDILIVLRSDDDTILYSKVFTFDEAVETMGYGHTFWVGERSETRRSNFDNHLTRSF